MNEKNNSAASEKKKAADNVVFIGSKPLVNYVKSVVSQFLRGNHEEVIIKSRGKFISKAVDVAEIAKRSEPLQKIKVFVKSIEINSEEFKKDDRELHVSTIDITLSR